MLAYYKFPRIGTGKSDDGYRPDVPSGFTSWSVVEEGKDDFLVEVEADDAYHAALNPAAGKLAEEVIEYETVQVPVSRRLIDKRAGKGDVEVSVDDLKAQEVAVMAAEAIVGRGV